MNEVREYTFEGAIQTLDFYHSGEVKVLARNLDEAREKALDQICRIHRIGRNCVRLGKCIAIK